MHEKHPWSCTYFQKAKSNPCIRCYLRANEGENKSNSAQQPRGPLAELLWKVCPTAGTGKDRAHRRQTCSLVAACDKFHCPLCPLLQNGVLWEVFAHLLEQIGIACLRGVFWRLIHSTSLLNLFLIFWWLNPGLPCLPMPCSVKQMGCTYVVATMYFGQGQMQHSVECSQVTRWEQHSAAPRGPREASSALVGARSEDLPSSQCLAEALEELQCFHPAGRKTSLRLTCPTQRHFALHPANAEVLQPPNSAGEGADSSRIAELNPSNSNDGIVGLLQILTITKFRPCGAFLQSLRVVELIWKPLY